MTSPGCCVPEFSFPVIRLNVKKYLASFRFGALPVTPHSIPYHQPADLCPPLSNNFTVLECSRVVKVDSRSLQRTSARQTGIYRK